MEGRKEARKGLVLYQISHDLVDMFLFMLDQMVWHGMVMTFLGFLSLFFHVCNNYIFSESNLYSNA